MLARLEKVKIDRTQQPSSLLAAIPQDYRDVKYILTQNSGQQNVFDEFPTPKEPPKLSAHSSSDPPSSPPKVLPSQLPSSDTPTKSTPQDQIPPSSPPQAETAFPTSAKIDQSSNVSSTDPNTVNSNTLPPPLLAEYDYIVRTIGSTFREEPPHTIQRFSELLLYPKQHYRYLPAYLNALGRLVAVSSTSVTFPLPPIESAYAASVLVNGTSSTTTHAHEGEDNLGGALLTPIPWLNDANGDGEGMEPNGVDSADGDAAMTGEESARVAGAVTQGELLRQEQAASSHPAPIVAGRGQSTRQAEDVDDMSDETKDKAEHPEPDVSILIVQDSASSYFLLTP